MAARHKTRDQYKQQEERTMLETTATIEGNAAKDPELRFTKQGTAVCELSVMVNSRRKVDGQWQDGEPTAYGCVVWGRLAENVAETISKGVRVIVHGRIYTDAWTGQDGEIRTRLKLNAEAVGVSLQFHGAKVTKIQRANEQQPAEQGGDDPWATQEPPF